MTADDPLDIIPFRWNVARREQLGSLLDGDPVNIDQAYLDELRAVSAKVVALASDMRLVFVGRSPENLFDYLSGVFADVSDAPELTLLHYSNRGWDIETLAREHPQDVAALQRYFRAECLDPSSLAAAPAPIRFVDLVSEGGTFGTLAGTLRHFATAASVDWNAVQRRIGFIGITSRTKNSPNTWRWWQHQDWIDGFKGYQISSISISPQLWNLLGNSQDKVTPSHPVSRWADVRVAKPLRSERALRALRRAVALFETGATAEERRLFSRELATTPQMADATVRSLVGQLKRQ